MDSETSFKSAEETSKSSDELQKLLLETARTQLAALSAVTNFWAGWAVAAGEYNKGIGNELARISEDSANSKDSAGRLTDLTREYLRNVIELPNAAVRQFSEEIVKVPKTQVKRSRSARTKP